MKIKKTIENLYSVFSVYYSSDMHYCDCGCVDEGEVKKLNSKMLKDLREDDFCTYHGSALYTWGELQHYKHFLPRILEVHHQKEGKGLIGLFEIQQKFEYAKWESWDENEVKAIREFILADWWSFANKTSSEIRMEDLENYSFFLKPQDLLKVWDLSINEKALKNFVHFFYREGTNLMNKEMDSKGKPNQFEIGLLLNQKGLVESLENEFFKADKMDQPYAEKISIVLQMVEQYSKILKE